MRRLPAALTAIVGGDRWITGECAFGGALCAVVFLPVCLVVIGAARRAQRARLGSIVAGSDRRTVWGILAIPFSSVTTPEALNAGLARVGRRTRGVAPGGRARRPRWPRWP